MHRWARLLAFMLAAWPAAAQPFQGYVGRLDAVQLDQDWYTLTTATMPSFPLEGATVTLLDCEENCPDPVQTDAAGWFTIPGLGRETALLRFDPPICTEEDTECEPLEPRQEALENGGRTVLGAKWPTGIEDTILRYSPARRQHDLHPTRRRNTRVTRRRRRRRPLGGLGHRPPWLATIYGVSDFRARADARVRISTEACVLA